MRALCLQSNSPKDLAVIDTPVPAPGPDEMIIALGAASSGRPHHRIGNRYMDMEEMQVDQTGKSVK